MKSVFTDLKVGQRVYDTWYGPGVVVSKTKRHAKINLSLKGAWVYDRAHINGFIRIGREPKPHKFCTWCKGEVPRGYRRTATGGKARPAAKTFYHYACVGWRKKAK